jgi:hypothetical protein
LADQQGQQQVLINELLARPIQTHKVIHKVETKENPVVQVTQLEPPKEAEVESPMTKKAVGLQRENLILDRLEQIEKAVDSNKTHMDTLANNVAKEHGLTDLKL